MKRSRHMKTEFPDELFVRIEVLDVDPECDEEGRYAVDSLLVAEESVEDVMFETDGVEDVAVYRLVEVRQFEKTITEVS
jgi:hypothetical protein